jgi:hypothetical protein
MTPEQVQTLIQNSGQTDELYLGTRRDRVHGGENPFTVSDGKRTMHTLMIGPTRSGKTQSMVHAALQDAEKGNGFCMIIPKGAALDELLAKLPDDRLDDVHYINPEGVGSNPANTDVAGINVLEPHNAADLSQVQREKQVDLIVSDLLGLFRRQSESWGDRFGRNLKVLLQTHINLNIDRGESNTLIDVYDCVTSASGDSESGDAFNELIDKTDDHILRKQLRRARNEIQKHGAGPIERRLSDFTGSKTIRNVIAAKNSAVDFKQVVDNGEIVLLDIQKGSLSDTAVELIGSIVITQVWAAAQSRIQQPEEERDLFTLYVDELHNFAGEGSNLAKILAEAAEYRLGCWLVTQYLRQLDSALQDAVISNCRTKMVFEPGDSREFSQLAGMFRGLDKDDLRELGEYRAAVQVPSSHEREEGRIIDTLPPWQADRDDLQELKQQVAAVSTDRAEIEDSTYVGETAAAGGEQHFELLDAARQRLEDEHEGAVVDLWNQDGDSKPDGQVIFPDRTNAYLEAEQSTLSKPAKVLTNHLRAAKEGYEVIFVVESGKGERLEEIVSDPVNRQGDTHEDDEGSYDYYQGDDGAFGREKIDQIEDAEYRVLEVSPESDCPMLDEQTKEQLQEHCIHRGRDGFCNALDEPCVLIDTEV